MQENLGNKPKTMAKEFSFDIDEGYKETIIGEGNFSEGYTKYTILPNFANNSLADVQDWANKNGVKLNIKYVQRSGGKENWVISMDQPVSKRVDRIPNQTVTIEVIRNGSSTNTNTITASNKIDCTTDTTNSVCSIPNFVGKTKQDIISWASKFSNSINVTFDEIESEQSSGTILEQSLNEGTTVKSMIDNSTTLTIKIAK
jgi:beta-lactam-binding protein with PASTA domain